jgi:hypothetical protein
MSKPRATPAAHDAHHRVEPDPTEETSRQKCGDREDGRQRVGEDVDKGGAKIVIVMLTGMTMIMAVVMIATAMVMAAAKKQRTDDVDDQPDPRHDRRFRKSDLTRLQQTPDRLDGNPERDDAEDQCGCEAGKISDLARTEAEAAACGIALGEGVGTGCDRERSGMRRHMEAVRQQRHRVEASSAIELKIVPATISPTIITAVRMTTHNVRRAFSLWT